MSKCKSCRYFVKEHEICALHHDVAEEGNEACSYYRSRHRIPYSSQIETLKEEEEETGFPLATDEGDVYVEIRDSGV